MNILTGLKAWLWQRISAVALIFGIVYIVISFCITSPVTYEQWQQWVHASPRFIILIMLILALLSHSWIGMRDVLLDYVKPDWLRVILLLLLAASVFFIGIWSISLLLP